MLLFVNVLTEGYDSESSYDLVLHECRSELWQGRSYPPEYVPLCVLGDYAPTKSMGAFIQFWGRGSRVHKDKPWLRLLSHAGNEDGTAFSLSSRGVSLEHKQSRVDGQAARAEYSARRGCVTRRCDSVDLRDVSDSMAARHFDVPALWWQHAQCNGASAG